MDDALPRSLDRDVESRRDETSRANAQPPASDRAPPKEGSAKEEGGEDKPASPRRRRLMIAAGLLAAILVLAGGAYVILRHRPNLQRMLAGTEPRLGKRPAP